MISEPNAITSCSPKTSPKQIISPKGAKKTARPRTDAANNAQIAATP